MAQKALSDEHSGELRKRVGTGEQKTGPVVRRRYIPLRAWREPLPHGLLRVGHAKGSSAAAGQGRRRAAESPGTVATRVRDDPE